MNVFRKGQPTSMTLWGYNGHDRAAPDVVMHAEVRKSTRRAPAPSSRRSLTRICADAAPERHLGQWFDRYFVLRRALVLYEFEGPTHDAPKQAMEVDRVVPIGAQLRGGAPRCRADAA